MCGGGVEKSYVTQEVADAVVLHLLYQFVNSIQAQATAAYTHKPQHLLCPHRLQCCVLPYQVSLSDTVARHEILRLTDCHHDMHQQLTKPAVLDATAASEVHECCHLARAVKHKPSCPHLQQQPHAIVR